MVIVTDNELVVRLKNHDKVFSLDSVLQVAIGRKIMLFPTIIGGISCPLFLVGAFNQLGNIWLMMSLAFAGLLAVYYGLAGSDAFIVRTRVKEFDFFIDLSNPFINRFCNFFNSVIKKGRIDRYFCLSLDSRAVEDLERTGQLVVPESGLPLIPIDQLPMKPNGYYVISAPLANGYRIGYEVGPGNEIVPILHSNVSAVHLEKISHS